MPLYIWQVLQICSQHGAKVKMSIFLTPEYIVFHLWYFSTIKPGMVVMYGVWEKWPRCIRHPVWSYWLTYIVPVYIRVSLPVLIRLGREWFDLSWIRFVLGTSHDDVIKMETFSALVALCAGNPPVPGEFPAQRPVTRSFGAFFHLRLNKRLNKQSWGWWFEAPSRPLWCHCNMKGGVRAQMACSDKEKNYNIILSFGYGDMTNDGYHFHSPFMINIRANSTINQLRNKILRICLANYLLTNYARHQAVA